MLDAVRFFCVQLEDLAKLSIKGEVVQAAKMPTGNAYRRGDNPGTRSRWVQSHIMLLWLLL